MEGEGRKEGGIKGRKRIGERRDAEEKLRKGWSGGNIKEED